MIPALVHESLLVAAPKTATFEVFAHPALANQFLAAQTLVQSGGLFATIKRS